VGRRNDNVTEALLHTTAASFSASLPSTPFRHLAVNRLRSGGMSGGHSGLVGLNANSASIPVRRELERNGDRGFVVAETIDLSFR